MTTVTIHDVIQLAQGCHDYCYYTRRNAVSTGLPWLLLLNTMPNILQNESSNYIHATIKQKQQAELQCSANYSEINQHANITPSLRNTIER